MSGRRLRSQPRPRNNTDLAAQTADSTVSPTFDSESPGETIDAPHVRQRAKQACQACRNQKCAVNLPTKLYELFF